MFTVTDPDAVSSCDVSSGQWWRAGGEPSWDAWNGLPAGGLESVQEFAQREHRPPWGRFVFRDESGDYTFAGGATARGAGGHSLHADGRAYCAERLVPTEADASEADTATGYPSGDADHDPHNAGVLWIHFTHIARRGECVFLDVQRVPDLPTVCDVPEVWQRG